MSNYCYWEVNHFLFCMSQVFSEKKDQQSQKFLLDAMPLVGTTDSVLIMQDLFTSGDLSQDEIDAWLTSLLFHKKPTLPLLDAVKVCI